MDDAFPGDFPGVFTWDVRTELSTDQLSRRQGLSRRNSQIDGTKK